MKVTRKKLASITGIFAVSACLSVPTVALAAGGEFIEDVGASERINFSGKLRMLSQRIPAAVCYANADVEPEKSQEMFESASAEFHTILAALEFGDESLNIKGAEEDRKVLASIKKLHGQWDPFYAKVNEALSSGKTDELVKSLSMASDPLLEEAKLLVSEMVAEYADPTALLQSDAITIDIAGRQRMLAQRISKFSCMAQTGVDIEVSVGAMTAAREMYDVSVNALRFGMPAAGLSAPDSDAIVTGLDDVLADWADIQPTLDSVAAGENISKERMGELFNAMNTLTGKMNKLVGVYTEESKLGL